MFLKWFLLPGSIYWPRRKLSLYELCNIMQQLIFGIYNTIEIILIKLSGNFLTHMFNSPYIGPLINKGVHPWLNHQYPKWWQGESYTCVQATTQARITTDYPNTLSTMANQTQYEILITWVYALCMVWIEYNEQNNACLQTMNNV